MYKIGIIGDKDSVLGFMAVGFSVAPASGVIEGASALRRLVRENCAVIFITEELALNMQEEIDRYKNEAVPAIIVIPGKDGSNGYGMQSIKNTVERAVGADILFKE